MRRTEKCNHLKSQSFYSQGALSAAIIIRKKESLISFFSGTCRWRGKIVKVQVDLLSGEYGGTGKRHRHQDVQGIKARKARGCDIAFDMVKEVPVEGKIPGGGHDRVTIRVASIVPFFVMKGMALDDRLKEKDAWDIYYCIIAFPGGIDALVEEFRPHLSHGLVLEGLKKIAKHFVDIKSIGPKFVADFEGTDDPDEVERITRDAFERVNAFWGQLEIDKY